MPNNTTNKILPTLIFGDENHASPNLRKLIIKLFPRLKSMGYESFFDEQPQGESREFQREEFSKTIYSFNKQLDAC